MAKNALDIARANKEDEYYTLFEDIEKELSHYKNYFKDKVVFLNCDDPEYSNFWKYFQLKFYDWGIKKLISTHYVESGSSYKMEIVSNNVEFKNGEQLGLPDYIKTPLVGNGDFRSEECVKLLKEADVVVTNPPFSLFREFINQLMEYKKDFVIIGNITNITYKEFFPYLKNNQIWQGYHSGGQSFIVPESYDKGNTYYESGKKYAKFGNICWYTNIDIQRKHEEFIPTKKYNEKDYPKFDNYDAIFVSKVADIPMDYKGIMGVPISFMDKYNPDQFNIVGLVAGNIKGLAGLNSKTGKDGPYVDGKLKFGRIFIQWKESELEKWIY